MKLNAKRLISLVLAIVMSLSLLATAAFAADTAVGTNIPMDTDITREDLFIPHDVAREIAKLFLKDALSFPDINWNENTAVVNSVTMYDAEEGGDITAYTFELTEGYIVVAAYLDAANTILEWSDRAAPMYKEFKNRASSRIVYLGNLNYYQDTGADKLLTVDGLEVKRAETVNAIAQTSSLDNIQPKVLEDVIAYVEQKHEVYSMNSTGYIDDPFEHAKMICGEEFVAKSDDWCNKWENYMSFETTGDYKFNSALATKNHCGPTAILILMLSYKNRFGFSAINNLSKRQLFTQIAQYGLNNGYYSVSGGTPRDTADSYIKGIFSYFGKNVTVSNLITTTFEAVVNRLKDNDLLYMSLTAHPTYDDHAVICYAYCRLVGKTSGWYKTYYKVADGHTSAHGRYIDIGTTTNSVFRYINL